MPRADRRCIVAQRGDGQARLAQYADREPRATLDSDGQVTLAFAAAGEKNCAYCISSRYAPCAVALPGSASHGDDLRCSQERGAAVALSRQGGPAFKAPPENHCVIRAICELHPRQDAPRLAGIVMHPLPDSAVAWSAELRQSSAGASRSKAAGRTGQSWMN